MCRPPSSGRVRGRAWGLPHPASGWRSRPSVTLHVCVLTGAPRRRRRGRCPPFHAPTPARRRPIVQRCPTGGGRRWFPGASSAGRWLLHFPGRAPPVPSPLPVLSAQLPAMLIIRRRDGVPSSAGNGAGSGWWSPLHPSCPRRWSNSDHPGKSMYSGEIDYRFLTFQTESRF